MRAANMQALTKDLKNRYPGIVVYGIGDDAHKQSVSDHNEDDTPGSLAEQWDGDNVPEHRAIDAMISGAFGRQEADALVTKIVNDATSRNRLHYIIWHEGFWSRENGWTRETYYGDNPHRDHIHFSGWAPDDENASGWPVVYAAPGSGPSGPRLRRQWPSFISTSEYFGHINGPNESHGGFYPKEKDEVKAIQERLNALGYRHGMIDGIFGNNTKNAVTAWQRARYANLTSRYGEIWIDDWQRLFTY